jgi:hypothetical protein
MSIIGLNFMNIAINRLMSRMWATIKAFISKVARKMVLPNCKNLYMCDGEIRYIDHIY